MSEISSRQFGLTVAYVVPGFVGLAGTVAMFPMVAEWLRPVNQGDVGFGPTVYALLAATAMGMIVSCVRWLIIDHIHAWTGIAAPVWDFRLLEDRLAALSYLVDNHYRYYLFYANTLVAVLWAYLLNRFIQTSPLMGPGTDLGVFILCAVLFAGSRDALARYFQRAGQLVGEVAEKDRSGEIMTNGIGHHGEGAGASKVRQDTKPPVQAKTTPKPPPDTKDKTPSK